MNRQQGRLYWITGLSGAGKTTIGTQLYYELKKTHDNVVLIDNDSFKSIIDVNPGYSKEERYWRGYKANRFFKMLADQGMIVIACTISMNSEFRNWNRENNKEYIEVFLDVPQDVLRSRDKKDIYKMQATGKMNNVVGVDQKADLPKNPDLTIVNDGSLSVNECVDMILKVKPKVINRTVDDSSYWDSYYMNKLLLQEPSTFVSYINKYFEAGKKIVDLGCGNGCDSNYFGENNLITLGVDYANELISRLQKENNSKNVTYINDDFTTSKVLFLQNFDYCYSRLSFESINKYQQDILLANVYKSLCKGGYFFVEARTIHDEIFGLGEAVEGEENAYIYEDHYRRFIDMNEFVIQLKELGFTIIEAFESNNLSKHGTSNPTLMRIIARKD